MKRIVFLKNELEQIVNYHQIPLFESEFADDDGNNIENNNEAKAPNLNTNNNIVSQTPEPRIFYGIQKPALVC